MIYLVDFPTRINANTTKSAIDNIIIKKKDLAHVNVTGVITTLSDHDGQVLNLKFKVPIQVSANNFIIKEQHSFTKENLSLFSKLLHKESWLDVYFAPSTEKYDMFYNLFKFYFKQGFPKKVIKVQTKKRSWITQDLKDEKNNLVKQTKKSRQFKDKEKQKEIKKNILKYKKNLIESKKLFYKNIIENSVYIKKDCLECINNETGNKIFNTTKSNFEIKLHSNIYTDPEEMSNLFNEYFINAVKDTRDCCLQDPVSTTSQINKDIVCCISKPVFKLKFIESS